MTTVIKKQTAKLTPTSDREPIKIHLSCPTSVDEVKISFDNPQRDQPNVTDYTMQLLKEIFIKCCITHATITSTIRTSSSQIEAMYKNLKKKQSPTYSAGGKALIKIYQEMTNSGKSEAEIIAAMQKHSDEIVAQGGVVSAHMNPYNTLFYNVIDFNLWTMVKGDTGSHLTKTEEPDVYKNFNNAFPKIRKVHDPKHEKDPALHLEIPQPIAYNNDEIAAMEKQKPFEQPNLAKLAIERARGLSLHSLKYVKYPYIFYKP